METLEQLWAQIIEFVPTMLAALGIFVLGWIVAVAAAGIVRALFRRTTMDERMGQWLAGDGKKPLPVDRWLANVVKWVILLLTLLLVFATLGLTAAAGPLDAMLDEVLGFLPNLAAAAVFLLIGWLLSRALRFVVERALGAMKLDQRLSKAAGDEEETVLVTRSIGSAVYWLVWLFIFMLVLDALELQSLLDPLKEMMAKVTGSIPNIAKAALVLVVGWFGATIVKRIVVALLVSVGLDRLAERTGVDKEGKGRLSGLVGTVVFILILLPVLTAALDSLGMEEVSEPLSLVLTTLFGAIPLLLYAALVLGVAIVVGRLVAALVTDLLARIGFDDVLRAIGLTQKSAADLEPKRRPSAVCGTVVFVAIILLASMQALSILGLQDVSEFVSAFVDRAGGWLLGLAIFGAGLWLANLVGNFIAGRGGAFAGVLALATRIGITVFAAIAALREMELPDDVVSDAVLLLVAGAALAIGLAFGLGCREQAADQVRRWRGQLDEDGGATDGDDSASDDA